jgi:hypothetical protein
VGGTERGEYIVPQLGLCSFAGRCYGGWMKKLVLALVAAFALGGLALPAQASASTGVSAVCKKKHKHHKRHGKKKNGAASATKSPAPSNI